MKSETVLTLADRIIEGMKVGKSAFDSFQELISAGYAAADLLRVETCIFAETRKQGIEYSLAESDEIMNLLGAMSPQTAQVHRVLKEMECLADVFLSWISGGENNA